LQWCSAQLNVLELLGLNVRGLRTCREWASDRSVTLRLKAEERCVFDREEKREEDSKTKHVTTWTGAGGGISQRTDKTVTTITDYFWRFTAEWSLVVFVGNSPDDCVVLQQRSSKHEIRTSGKDTPRPLSVVRDPVDLNVTWLLQQIGPEGHFSFAIDRAAKHTYTPRRNDAVDEATSFASDWHGWSGRVSSYFRQTLFSAQADSGLDLSALNDDTLFVPVVPLLDPKPEAAAIAAPAAAAAVATVQSQSLVPMASARGPGAGLAVDTVNGFLNEQKRSLSDKCAELGRVFPDGGNARVISAAEAIVVVAAEHAKRLSQAYFDGVQSVEELIRQQLVRAIGKEVSTTDFAKYMVYHGRQLFRPEYQPRPFCYAVRRPDHVPEGVLSLEAHLADGSMAEPVHTLVSRSAGGPPMAFSIHAAATVSFTGETFVHGWLDHVFSGDSSATLSLTARARQFSSFLVLVGRIAGPGLFDPAYGMIVQNKDEVRIPLTKEMIPSAGEFREALQSLSDEQQRFAKAYRGMQLASTLFAVCVIQIKPQLEKLLKLNNDTLTKEIRLTQDLLQLFIKYQVPSDLLSYAGVGEAPDAVKVAEVKGHVGAMYAMIDRAEKKQIGEERDKQTIRLAEGVASVKKPFIAPEKNKGRKIKKKMIMKEKNDKSSSKIEEKRKGEKTRSRTNDDGEEGGVRDRSRNDGGGNDNNAPVQIEIEMIADAPPPAAANEEGGEAKQGGEASTAFVAAGGAEGVPDLTRLPALLDERFEALDADRALHATILGVGNAWQKKSQPSLLSAPTDKSLGPAEQRLEKQACWDLLDALSKSGCLGVEHASLHVVVASSHVFDLSVMDTLVQRNMDPIVRVQNSQLIIASTIHNRPVADLVKSRAEIEPVTPAPMLALK
jgi:hypothetical protein